MYLVILIGNGVLIIASIFDSHLHTPIYFFLGNLSFLDELNLKEKEHFLLWMCSADVLRICNGVNRMLLLGMMAFDCYVAICNPLRYPVLMSKVVYVLMASVSWLSSGINSVVQTSLAMRLPFCENNVINHFPCEILAVLKLACADISLSIITMTISNMAFLILPLLIIFFSYMFSLYTILRMNSATGRHKAFSTCSAYLTVVIIFYDTIFFMYAKPTSQELPGENSCKLLTSSFPCFTV
ncbi:hypothetical protein E2I00_004695 [Balaenoptera physalus]|uniref:G-protein coupled receptors family 1 profile domain-containing protein n=1 Tax=Balaenoptera physalus TaxID=9770 RepID=A0A6A1QET3_BALPH|nr:hypothetical protein E2I00_004695 [Balaenoptera physalus]